MRINAASAGVDSIISWESPARTMSPGRSGQVRTKGSGERSPCTTSTGHDECSAKAALTDPKSIPTNPPCPRLPTMIMSAIFQSQAV